MVYGIIINERSVRKWHLDAIKNLKDNFQVLPVICFALASKEKPFKNNHILELYFNLFTSLKQLPKTCIEKQFEPNTLRIISLSTNYEEITVSSLQEALGSQMLDFILDLTTFQLKGNALSISKHGILKFKFTDNEMITNYPLAFDEIKTEKRVVNGQIIAFRNENEYYLLREFCIEAMIFSYRKTVNKMLHQSIDLLIQTVKDFQNNVNQSTPANIIYSTRKTPGIIGLGKLILKQLVCFFKFLWVRGCYVDNWNIGYINKPINTFLNKDENFEVNWVEYNKKNKFIADPFVIKENDALHLFYEELDYKEGVGYINTAKLEGSKLVDEKLILKTPYHLSYPYAFSDNGTYYFIPESAGACEISLYQATNFPNQWEKIKTLIPNFKGIDSTVFFHNGLWWIFTTEINNRPHTKLYAFYSDSVLGIWKSHQNNPIKVDIRSARGAGKPFFHEGELYRPAQDYCQDIEWRMRIQKITKLSPTEFEESEVRIINPFKGTLYPHKTHTLCEAGDITIIDGCQKVFILTHPWIIWFKIKRVSRFILKHIKK